MVTESIELIQGQLMRPMRALGVRSFFMTIEPCTPGWGLNLLQDARHASARHRLQSGLAIYFTVSRRLEGFHTGGRFASTDPSHIMSIGHTLMFNESIFVLIMEPNGDTFLPVKIYTAWNK